MKIFQLFFILLCVYSIQSAPALTTEFLAVFGSYAYPISLTINPDFTLFASAVISGATVTASGTVSNVDGVETISFTWSGTSLVLQVNSDGVFSTLDNQVSFYPISPAVIASNSITINYFGIGNQAYTFSIQYSCDKTQVISSSLSQASGLTTTFRADIGVLDMGFYELSGAATISGTFSQDLSGVIYLNFTQDYIYYATETSFITLYPLSSPSSPVSTLESFNCPPLAVVSKKQYIGFVRLETSVTSFPVNVTFYTDNSILVEGDGYSVVGISFSESLVFRWPTFSDKIIIYLRSDGIYGTVGNYDIFTIIPLTPSVVTSNSVTINYGGFDQLFYSFSLTYYCDRVTISNLGYNDITNSYKKRQFHSLSFSGFVFDANDNGAEVNFPLSKIKNNLMFEIEENGLLSGELTSISSHGESSNAIMFYPLSSPSNSQKILSSMCCMEQEYGNANWGQTSFGSTIVGNCLSGFSGSPSRQCTSLGWKTHLSGTFCSQLMCPLLANDGGAKWPVTKSNMTVSRSCISPAKGIVTRLCQLDGNWGPIDGLCQAMTYQNAKYNTTSAGSMGLGVCVEGYSGNVSLECLANGQWNTITTTSCQRLYCQAIASQANTAWPLAPAGKTVSGKCAKKTTGSPSRMCGWDGNWQPVQGACL